VWHHLDRGNRPSRRHHRSLSAPGPEQSHGFLVTMVIGIAGAFVATFSGQSIGWYRHDQGAGLIGATLGSIIMLFIWHRLVVQRTVNDPGVSSVNWPPRRA
jgi:uncharacterized membrane protein YeaQ/YmgE (transglycosylase-associated protein family)